ncbi:hypothetical protein J3B02_002388 [Coemansia erecta]|uniref:Uncharacterized protein n=1 Tax=Coemansia asiatica TaxID=1052880 RepID=A0A9W7XRU6_9FUNG|nr:hypothetical protein LPJ64_000273 [Coemansia asiatica]KAJ2855003.1 hypothetical protein J3B02_002388 [Coemansia erecta]KAJ2887000.1 hypothetical protein FB639_001457 [Coemansia asiatica]
MDRHVWTEAASTVLATLESAFLGEDTSSPLDLTTAARSSTGRPTHNSRKHTRRSTSDTMSDIETCGSPVKRRRESLDGTYTDGGEPSRSTAKSRKITSALSRQFARSLSVSKGSAVVPVQESIEDSQMVDDNEILADNSENRSSIPLSTVSSSSSSSFSSISQWPSTANRSSRMSLAESTTTTMSQNADFFAAASVSTANLTPANRVFVFPSIGRSLKAREKNSSHLADSREPHRQPVQWSGMMDMGSSDGHGIMAAATTAAGLNGSVLAEKNVFASLLAASAVPADLETTGSSVAAAVRQWAVDQAMQSANQSSPELLIHELETRVSRLKELVAALMDQMAHEHKRALMAGDQIREFYRAGCEVGDIGEWMERRRFQLLSAFVPSLGQVVPQLHNLISVARVVEDMHRMVQWTPEFAPSLADMAAQYEDLVVSKRALYGDVICQDGLQWRAIGLPVDSLLLVRVRQWMESASEICLARVARVYERWANSASASDKEEMSTDSLIAYSSQILHCAAICAQMCGNGFPSLASCALYIVSECTMWTCSRLRLPLAAGSHQGSTTNGIAVLRGKRLVSRALRLVQAYEGILKQLSYVKAMLVSLEYNSIFDVHLEHGDIELANLQSLASSLVEASWLLAENLAAFRADGQMSRPSGVVLLFAEFVLKFSKRIVDFGACSDSTSAGTRVGQQLRRMQTYVQSLSLLAS